MKTQGRLSVPFPILLLSSSSLSNLVSIFFFFFLKISKIIRCIQPNHLGSTLLIQLTSIGQKVYFFFPGPFPVTQPITPYLLTNPARQEKRGTPSSFALIAAKSVSFMFMACFRVIVEPCAHFHLSSYFTRIIELQLSSWQRRIREEGSKYMPIRGRRQRKFSCYFDSEVCAGKHLDAMLP